MSQAPPRFNAPFQVILMFAIILATILLGFFMMPGNQEERDQLLRELGTTNHGILLDPVVFLKDLPFSDADGKPWLFEEKKPKWRLLIPGGARCEDECENLLYITRQVHMRLAKYSHRVERFYVALDGQVTPELKQHLSNNHSNLTLIQAPRTAFDAWLAETNSRWSAGTVEAILVDPAGVAMMVYDASHSGNGILEDINHLLKYSPE